MNIDMNTKHNADIVITGHPAGYVIWQNNNVIGNVNSAVLDLIVAGASARKLSVYDTEAGQFLTGTLDQLLNQSKEA